MITHQVRHGFNRIILCVYCVIEKRIQIHDSSVKGFQS